MLYQFLTANRDELVQRCRDKVAKRSAPQPTATELEHGIPLFLDQLITTLRHEQFDQPGTRAAAAATTMPPGATEIGKAAAKHGDELLRKGFTVDQVVHDYGDLCQAVTEAAAEKNAPVTVDEFRTFNRCLDNAIADAVTEFGRQRDLNISDQGAQAMNERLGGLAHELRNLLNSAMLAFQAVKSGSVAPAGATGAVLERSLIGLRNLIDRSLADVRLSAGFEVQREHISLGEFIDEVQVAAAMEAKARGIGFTVSPVDKELAVDADRQMLSSAVSNLLQNAFKFTRPNSQVSLTAHGAAERVVIDVADECGGIPKGTEAELFQPFKQLHSVDRTGLGLGLSICRRSVEANGGQLRVRNLPGKGCIFEIDLPRAARPTDLPRRARASG